MPIEEKSHEKPGGLRTIVWAIFFFVVFALIVDIWVQKTGPTNQIEDQRAAARNAKRLESLKADEEKLTTMAWIDKAKGIVRIPVSDARKLAIAELKEKKPKASSIKVEPPLPMPAPYDPDAAEPAPPALPSSPQGADTVRFEAPVVAVPQAAAPAAAPAPSESKK